MSLFFIYFIGDIMHDYRKVYSFLNRVLITSLLTVLCLIFFKKSNSFKESFYNKFFSDNFDFAYINNLYKEHFKINLPFNVFSEPVFNERLSYDSSSSYLDGVSLIVSSDYLIPSLDSGLVVFIGEKDGYGKTVIIENKDGIDIWYSNLSSVNVKLYSYVSEGSIIGNCNGLLYLVFKKDGNVLDYKKYI